MDNSLFKSGLFTNLDKKKKRVQTNGRRRIEFSNLVCSKILTEKGVNKWNVKNMSRNDLTPPHVHAPTSAVLKPK